MYFVRSVLLASACALLAPAAQAQIKPEASAAAREILCPVVGMGAPLRVRVVAGMSASELCRAALAPGMNQPRYPSAASPEAIARLNALSEAQQQGARDAQRDRRVTSQGQSQFSRDLSRTMERLQRDAYGNRSEPEERQDERRDELPFLSDSLRQSREDYFRAFEDDDD
jgi:hypothetical protein